MWASGTRTHARTHARAHAHTHTCADRHTRTSHAHTHKHSRDSASPPLQESPSQRDPRTSAHHSTSRLPIHAHKHYLVFVKVIRKHLESLHMYACTCIDSIHDARFLHIHQSVQLSMGAAHRKKPVHGIFRLPTSPHRCCHRPGLVTLDHAVCQPCTLRRTLAGSAPVCVLVGAFCCVGGAAHIDTHTHAQTHTHTQTHAHTHTHSLTHSLTHSHLPFSLSVLHAILEATLVHPFILRTEHALPVHEPVLVLAFVPAAPVIHEILRCNRSAHSNDTACMLLEVSYRGFK